jgi:hypothetical protein
VRSRKATWQSTSSVCSEGCQGRLIARLCARAAGSGPGGLPGTRSARGTGPVAEQNGSESTAHDFTRHTGCVSSLGRLHAVKRRPGGALQTFARLATDLLNLQRQALARPHGRLLRVPAGADHLQQGVGRAMRAAARLWRPATAHQSGSQGCFCFGGSAGRAAPPTGSVTRHEGAADAARRWIAPQRDGRSKARRRRSLACSAVPGMGLDDDMVAVRRLPGWSPVRCAAQACQMCWPCDLCVSCLQTATVRMQNFDEVLCA